MGFKIKIVKTEGPLAKDEENEILRTLAGAFNEHDGYCKSLFTVEFLRWVHDQIAMDLAPDMWGAFAEIHKERGDQHQEIMGMAAKNRNLQDALDSKRDTLAAALEENKRLNQKVEAFSQELADAEDMREALANQEALIEEMQKDKEQAAKAYGDLAEQARMFHIKLRDADNAVLRLKARLYDLEYPEEAAPAGGQDPLRFPYQATA